MRYHDWILRGTLGAHGLVKHGLVPPGVKKHLRRTLLDHQAGIKDHNLQLLRLHGNNRAAPLGR
jgi:hypothetical protein